MYALIIDGKVAALSEDMPAFGSHESAMLMETREEGVRVGWLVEGGTLVAPSTPPAPDANQTIDAAILELEAQQHRATRELLLQLAPTAPEAAKIKLQEIEDRITALRAQRVSE